MYLLKKSSTELTVVLAEHSKTTSVGVRSELCVLSWRRRMKRRQTMTKELEGMRPSEDKAGPDQMAG